MVDIPKTIEGLPTSSPRWIGKSVRRVEDPLLITGRAEFIDNVTLPRMLHCAILRSPYAHARIKGVDTNEAEKLPGVKAVVTGEDAKRWSYPAATMPEGWGTYCLAVDKARFVGEPVAAVAATSRYVAEDALELINVDYEPLEPVVDPAKAIGADSPLIFEERGNNIMYQRVFTWGNVEDAFREADHVFTEKFRWHRLGANPLETFGVISEWNPAEGSVTCRGGFQSQSMTGGASAEKVASAGQTSLCCCRGRPVDVRSSGSKIGWSTWWAGAAKPGTAATRPPLR
jgi:CO/xanthine dehydrogenase Mo-binding subunit